MSPQTVPQRIWRLAHVLMFASGALALVYEILWMRRFASVFGATTPAVAATLAAMFLGLCAGSLAAMRHASRLQHPLRTYALLEVGIGLGALGVEPLLHCYERVYPALYHSFAGSSATFMIVKTLLAVLALSIPGACMGATVPVLGQAIATHSPSLGRDVSLLYAANTAGAAVGAWSVPTFWLPIFTAQHTYFICVAGSVLIGATAFLGQRGVATVPLHLPEKAAFTRKAATSLTFRSLLLLAALSGFCFFCLQVYWSRMFAQVHHNSIYSFSIILAVLLGALGAASVLVKLLLRRGWSAARLASSAWIASGLTVFLTPLLFCSLTNGLSYLPGNWSFAYALRILWLSVPTVLLPALLGGMVFPLLIELAGTVGNRSAGRVIGALLAVNTAGSIAGSLFAAFVLPPHVGMWIVFAGLGIVMIVAGESSLRDSKRWLRRAGLIIAAALLWIVTNPSTLPRTKVRADQGEKLLAITESSHGIIAVIEKGQSRRMKLNNYYVLGGTASVGDERMQGHLPLLLHPAPRRVAFLGLGTGITAGAAMLHPAESITAIEIVPEVIHIAREYFSAANLGVVQSPRARTLAEDARNLLMVHTNSFDVIVGDLFVPWHQGEASLYTADAFRAAREALAAGGIFCQWLPMFQLSEQEFNIVAATFLDVFPSATLWRGDFSPIQPALALIGHKIGTQIDPAAVEKRVREVKRDPDNPTLAHSAGVWMFCIGPLHAEDARFRTAKRNRENEPWLELLGPKNHAGSGSGRSSLFVGRALNEYLAVVRAGPCAGTPLEYLTEAENRWREAGEGIAQATHLLATDQRAEAVGLMQRSIAMLPPEVQKAFGD